eukprot:7387836-Prymnesium_polylepis.1
MTQDALKFIAMKDAARLAKAANKAAKVKGGGDDEAEGEPPEPFQVGSIWLLAWAWKKSAARHHPCSSIHKAAQVPNTLERSG